MSQLQINSAYVPNTSAIPNILFDYWMHILTPAEFKVLMCIARKTYGWHKSYDRISLKQIENMTGLGKSGIVNNVEALIEHGLVSKLKSKTSDGDDAPNQYEINIHFLDRVVHSVDPRGSPFSGQQVVHSVDTQKKDLQKKDCYIETTTTIRDPEKVHPEKDVVVVSKSLPDLFYKNAKGQVKSITDHDIWMHFISLPFPTQMVCQAVEIARQSDTQVGNILKFLEGICLNLTKNENKPLEKKKKDEIKCPIPDTSNAPKVNMADFLPDLKRRKTDETK